VIGPKSPRPPSSDRRRFARRRSFPHPIPEKLGLVCAGGGVTGAIYEIGALAALEDRLQDASLLDFDVFVGVSAGAYLSAFLANGVSPGLLYRNVTRSTKGGTALDELALFRLNLPEIAGRIASAPITVLEAAWDFYKNSSETTLTDLVTSLGQLLPSGIFDNVGLQHWLQKWLEQHGRTDDFRKLERTLRIVAVELDTGETTTFGRPGTDDVPISEAVAASCALPGLYKPVRIRGTEYIDGGVRKTAHISLALRERCGLVLCINPIVPYRMSIGRTYGNGNGNGHSLSSRGLPSILDQVFRVTLHSRMRYGMERYGREVPEADILVFEPRPEDLPRFMRNIMRTSGRARIAEYAYRTTMQTLDADFPRLSRLFAKHGLKLRASAPLTSQTLRRALNEEARLNGDMPTRLTATLDTLEQDLDRMMEKR